MMIPTELQPTLIRTSRLSPEFIREHLDIINVPIRLKIDDSFGQMVDSWSSEEHHHERRLVLMTIDRESLSTFRISCLSVPPGTLAREKNQLVISCVWWEERQVHVVTSVDLLLVLESLVNEHFSVDEKSRIRRNLQFLKPTTVTRVSAGRLFNSLMAMENPRPRNIEKDLKVFQWGHLFDAVNKVLFKYSANPLASDEAEVKMQPIPSEENKPSALSPATKVEIAHPPTPAKSISNLTGSVKSINLLTMPWSIIKNIDNRQPRPRKRASDCSECCFEAKLHNTGLFLLGSFWARATPAEV